MYKAKNKLVLIAEKAKRLQAKPKITSIKPAVKSLIEIPERFRGAEAELSCEDVSESQLVGR